MAKTTFCKRPQTVTDYLTGLIWCRDANLAQYIEPDSTWALYLDKGAVAVGQKTQARFYVWAVRN